MKPKALYYNRFLIETEIARGGFATIYQAADQGLGTRVAVKLGNISSDPGYAKAMREEARILSQMNHRCVVRLLLLPRAGKAPTYVARALDVPGQPYFFVMELLGGGNLDQYLRSVGKVTVAEAAAIALEVARGLRHVHKRGYAHNDLKLENVVFRYPVRVGEPFSPVLVDFGIATRVYVQIEAGSLYVMAPEQISQVQMHSPPEFLAGIDPKLVDVWGMGVLLYRMLGGRLPFEGRSEKRLTDSILTSRPKSLAHLAEDIPRQMEELVIDGCLAKNPGQRLDMLTLGRQLTQFVAGGGTARVAPGGSWFGLR